MTTAVAKSVCPMPVGEAVCGAPVPARRGPGRPRVYCDDPTHNATARLRAERAPGVTESPLARALALIDRAYAAAAMIRREARAVVWAAEQRALAAEVDAMAARRERDAALALRDLAVEEARDLRAAMARDRWGRVVA
ncbi:hypothetical protein GV792_04955 [Nocardia cyriacigeorgica]|uniref:hypothetical protein n=1 Tax=Nocardia cyriacigeorgica TaxID=135487 RepID=UPI0013B9F41D|nr:hypothetical protein [Nocardia cyriacigeorgica]NEW49393.1 hypothetical protein [Nocardia cyriacigeorgica]